MDPSSRGNAGVAALCVSALLVLLAAWAAYGEREPASTVPVTVGGPSGRDAERILDSADALCQRIGQERRAPEVPADLAFHREAPGGPAPVDPEVEDLTGSVEDSRVVLRWRVAGEPAGFRVERIGESGEKLAETDLPADARSFRDEPVESLRGARTYRVFALDRRGSAAGGEQEKVRFRERFRVEYLGAGEAGRFRFRVIWSRAGADRAAEFETAPGGGIGDRVPASGDLPPLDFRTGWTFAGPGGRRRVGTREVPAPRFTPDGLVRRAPDTGEVVFETRELPVATIEAGAAVTAPGPGGDLRELWLPKAKD